MHKVVGVDFGAKHIGLSRGDTMVRLATPLNPVVADGDFWPQLLRSIKDESADLVVVGLPRDNMGEETSQSAKCRVFAHELSLRLSDVGVKADVIMQDESLTSVVAESAMQKERHFDPVSLRDGTADSRAATIILQDYLEACHG